MSFRTGFFELNKLPIGDPHQFAIPTPDVPVINHEMGNFASFPLLDAEIARFTDNIKPYWLTPVRGNLSANGLLQENAQWSQASRQLFVFCWKNQLEALRKTEQVSGYEWWLLQDFWTAANGILDTYYAPKHPAETVAQLRGLNDAVQLLIAEPGDNLPLSDSAPRLQRAYTSKQTLRTSLFVSNYGAGALAGATVRWWVVGGPGAAVVCNGSTPVPAALPQGPALTEVAQISCVLPDRGGMQHDPQPPLTLSVRAELLAPAAAAHVGAGVAVGGPGSMVAVANNSWPTRVYALAEDGPSPPSRTVFTTRELCTWIPIGNMQCHIPQQGTAIPAGSVLVVQDLSMDVLGFAAAGATVLVLNNGTRVGGGQPAAPVFPIGTEPARYKTSWWLGSERRHDTNLGTVVYPAFAQRVAPGMADQGWADPMWYRLIEGGQNYLLDGLPFAAEVLVRSIDLLALNRNKALVWQAGVQAQGRAQGSGGGAIIVAGFNVLINEFRTGSQGAAVPEAAWLLHTLLQYAYTAPQPAKKLTLRVTACPGCFPAVNVNICNGTV